MPQPRLRYSDVQKARESIRPRLEAAQQRAAESGKPLLVIIGEDHYARPSYLTGMLVLQEAIARGISDIAIEMETLPETPRSVIRLNNTSAIIYPLLAQYYNRPIHAVDSNYSDAAPYVFAKNCEPLRSHMVLDHRNEAMAENVAAINRPTLLLVGASHLQALAEHPTLQHYEIIAFDVTEPGFLPPLPSTKFHHVHVAREMRDLSLDQMLQYALGPVEGARFSQWAEQRGYKPSTRDAAQNLKQATRQLAENPEDLSAMRVAGRAHYEMGHDREAARLFAKLKDLCALPENENGPFCPAPVLHPTKLAYSEEFNSIYTPPPRVRPTPPGCPAGKER